MTWFNVKYYFYTTFIAHLSCHVILRQGRGIEYHCCSHWSLSNYKVKPVFLIHWWHLIFEKLSHVPAYFYMYSQLHKVFALPGAWSSYLVKKTSKKLTKDEKVIICTVHRSIIALLRAKLSFIKPQIMHKTSQRNETNMVIS